MMVRLSDLKDGESGIVVSLGHRAQKQIWEANRRVRRRWRFRRRLGDMGITPGTRVKVVRSIPFNGPLEVLVRDSRLAIGRGMAEKILVEVKR